MEPCSDCCLFPSIPESGIVRKNTDNRELGNNSEPLNQGSPNPKVGDEEMWNLTTGTNVVEYVSFNAYCLFNYISLLAIII